jgi:hypothetical protein
MDVVAAVMTFSSHSRIEGSIFLGLQEHVAARFPRPAFVDVPLGLANHGEMAKLFQSDFVAVPKGRS